MSNRYCSNCAIKIPDGEDYCPNCGKKYNEYKSFSNIINHSSDKRRDKGGKPNSKADHEKVDVNWWKYELVVLLLIILSAILDSIPILSIVVALLSMLFSFYIEKKYQDEKIVRYIKYIVIIRTIFFIIGMLAYVLF